MKHKLVSLSDFLDIQKADLNEKSIVFTNGCFDILHPGHTDYLGKAKALGDILVVGVNTDQSVQRLKGNHRPIQNVKARSLVLSALASVDYVIEFDEDTPLNIIAHILPNILTKGGDYTEETIIGAKEVKEQGGSIEIIPFLEGYSTSKIEEKIKKSL